MVDEYRTERIKKMNAFIERKINPFPPGPFEKQPLAKVVELPLGEQISVAGRLVLFREMGNLTFFTLQDESGRMQIVLNKKEFPDDYKFWIHNLDLGDFVGVEGERFDTNKGERSVLARRLTLLTKAIRPLPDKHKGLADEETRLRKRYLDLLFNPEVKDMVYKIDKFWNSILVAAESRSLKCNDYEMLP